MKRSVYVFFLICAGIVIGSLLGVVTEDTQFFKFLSYGLNFGLTEPFVLDLSVVKFTFGLSMNLNVSVALCVILTTVIGLAVYRK